VLLFLNLYALEIYQIGYFAFIGKTLQGHNKITGNRRDSTLDYRRFLMMGLGYHGITPPDKCAL
jgi:hypothetical protein